MTNKRGSSEVIAVALITGFIAFAGVGAFTMATDLTDSAQSQVEEPEFQLEAGNQNEITYTGEQPITSKNTHKITVIQRDTKVGTIEEVIYNGSGDTEYTGNISNIRPGETIVNKSQMKRLVGGKSAQVIWYYKETDTQYTEDATDPGTHSEEVINSEIISEFYVPDESVTGTSVLTNGSVNVTKNSEVNTTFASNTEK